MVQTDFCFGSFTTTKIKSNFFFNLNYDTVDMTNGTQVRVCEKDNCKLV